MKLGGQNQKNETQKLTVKEKQGSNQKQTAFSKQQNPNQSIPSVHKPIKIFSSAYPAIQGQQLSRPQTSQNPSIINPIKKQQILIPQIESQVHFKLQQVNFKPENHHQPIKIREFREQDLNQLRKLQNEWFPLKYSDSFYKKIINKQCYCIVAETKIRKKAQLNDQNETNQKIIVGAAVFEITDSEGYVYKSWTQSFMSLLSTVEDSIYIMTLGVIDEFRKMGVGKMLVNRIIQIGKKYQNIKLISLHVISYNKAAIRFYQKMGFTNIETLNNFYHVGRKQYDGQFYGIFINEGMLNTGWSLKLRKLLK